MDCLRFRSVWRATVNSSYKTLRLLPMPNPRQNGPVATNVPPSEMAEARNPIGLVRNALRDRLRYMSYE
jgi:hypothetical protein